MKLLRSFSLGIMVALGLFVAFTFFLPSNYTVTQKIIINTTSDKVFPYINSLKQWEKWAFSSEENDMRKELTFHGPEEGAGAYETWEMEDGSHHRLEVTKSSPTEKVEVRLSVNDGSFVSEGIFELQSEGGNTVVTWTETGDFGYNFFARFYASISKFEDGISEKYAYALEQLKSISETEK